MFFKCINFMINFLDNLRISLCLLGILQSNPILWGGGAIGRLVGGNGKHSTLLLCQYISLDLYQPFSRHKSEERKEACALLLEGIASDDPPTCHALKTSPIPPSTDLPSYVGVWFSAVAHWTVPAYPEICW